MDLNELSATHREQLFQTLSEKQAADNNWDQVFALMRHGQKVAEQADMGELADQFASGQALLIDELKKGGQFMDWELQFMQLGMATGSLSVIYDRIAAHYRLLGAFLAELRRNLWTPLLIMLALVFGFPVLGYLLGEFSLYEATANLMLALVPGVALIVLVPLSLAAYRSGWIPITLRGLAFRLPGIGNVLSRYQTFQFLSHLNLCIASGFSMPQALKQSSVLMPPTPIQPQFSGIYQSVAQGEKLSSALQQSHILDGVVVPKLEVDATAEDAQLALTRAVYEDCVSQVSFWSRALPWLLMALVPYVVLVNVLNL